MYPSVKIDATITSDEKTIKQMNIKASKKGSWLLVVKALRKSSPNNE
jgi:hypothetical protein